uniref:BACK domain-containing protein n=1 Tax=Glossina morsitans morsitans TaxID=37546 RepID=A0A1B0G5E5_GLOMM
IQDLVEDNKLSVAWEDNAYKAIIKWIKYDLTKRQGYLANLMRHVRLTFVRTDFLRDHILTESMLTSDPQCSQFLIEALRYQLTPLSQRSSFWSQTTNVPTNRNATFHVLFAGGTHIKTGTEPRMCKVYDITNNKMSPISDMLDCRFGNSVISLNGTVYSVGGYCGNELRTAEYYDRINKKWTYIKPMNTDRCNFGICACDNLIYAIGGHCCSSVESYNPATNKWYTCPNTPFPFSWCCRAAVINHSIYSMCMGSCARFDSREGGWYNLIEMPGRLRAARFEFMSYESSLFSIAQDCSRLDIRANRWEAISSMLSKRFDYSAAIIADDIYVFGGASKADEDGEYINSVERYNIHNNQWTAVDSVEVKVRRGELQ